MDADWIVLYEYSAKLAEHAEVNHAWRLMADGRFERMQNPKGAERPADGGRYWIQGSWVRNTTLGEGDVAAVRKLIAENPPPEGLFRPGGSAERGDWARLQVRVGEGIACCEVEDRSSAVGETWMARLVVLLMPEWARIQAGQR